MLSASGVYVTFQSPPAPREWAETLPAGCGQHSGAVRGAQQREYSRAVTVQQAFRSDYSQARLAPAQWLWWHRVPLCGSADVPVSP